MRIPVSLTGDGITGQKTWRLKTCCLCAIVVVAVLSAMGRVGHAGETAVPRLDPVPIQAQSVQAQPTPQSGSPDTAFQPNVDCTCRFRGQDYDIGDSACIRGKLATCSTFLNNTSWAISTAPCPMTHNLSPARLLAGG